MQDKLKVLAVFGSIGVAVVLNVSALLVLWTNAISALLIQRLNRPSLCYILFVVTIVAVTHKEHSIFSANIRHELFSGDNQKTFLFEVATAWLNAKCLSFSLDRIRHRDHARLQSALASMAYTFYLPAFFTGPLFSYESFCNVSVVSSSPELITVNVAVHL